ncbi:hypothetical protein Hhel01_02569 [Haloferula helveola]
MVESLWELRNETEPGFPNGLDPVTAVILIRWAELEPESMIEAVHCHPLGYAAWARVDIEASLSSLEEWLASPAFAKDEANRWGPKDSAALLTTLAEVDPHRAAEFEEKLPEFAQLSEFERFKVRIPPDPEAVGWEMLNLREVTASLAFDKWVASDPKAAIRWLAAKLEKGEGSKVANEKVIAGALKSFPPEDLPAIAALLPPGEERSQLVSAYVLALANYDPSQAIEFARSQAGTANVTGLLAKVGQALADEDPRRSIDLLADLLRDYPNGGRIAVVLPDGEEKMEGSVVEHGWLKSLSMAAPQETMALLSSRTDAVETGSPAQILGREWMLRDQVGYAGWVNSLHPGPMQDAFLVPLVSEIANLKSDGRGYYPDRQEAIRRASRISDDESRRQMIRRLASDFQKYSPTGMAKFAESDAATDEVRAIYAEITRKAE